MDSSLLRFLAGWFLPIWPLVHWQDERLGWPAGESKVTKSPKCWYSTGFLFSVYLFSTAWKNIVMRETSKNILTTSARILLSHNWSWSQGGCWGALLRRDTLPQNCLGCRGPRPCCNPLRHLSQVDQLYRQKKSTLTRFISASSKRGNGPHSIPDWLLHILWLSW